MAKTCSIDDCCRPVKALGLCNSHYLRQSRHGSPHAGGASRGFVDKWLEEVAVPYDGDDCLEFPFAKDRNGYGHINDQKGSRSGGAHIFVAERVLGPKPSPGHEVCHSCGNGNKACVSPKHLYWGTRAQNVSDSINHGTFSRPPRHVGGSHPKARLSEEDVLRIREMVSSGARTSQLAEIFGVPAGVISSIKHRKSWKHI